MEKKYNFNDMPEADVIVKRVNSRLKKGLNTTIYIIGLSGTGKSSTSLRVAEIISETRERKPSVTITDDLLGLLEAIRKSVSGDIIVIEEASVLFPSRRAMAADNVDLGKILDTCRKKELCLIANAPIWKSIDSHMRALGHLLIETLRINKTEKVVVSKFHRLQTNPHSGETYRHTLQRDGKDVRRMFTKMPDMDRWNEYEKQKDIFMDKLYKTLQRKQQVKQIKIDRELSKDQWGYNFLSEKQVAIIKAIEKDGLSFKEASRVFKYADTEVARNMYNRAKERQENLKLEIEKNPLPLVQGALN